ncbi:MAG: ABC transporter permease [Planctomycetota bacterium]|nr:MAG: ABC transporter permease [Planctomycetota bacterium]
MRAVLALVKKEFLALVRDKRSRFVLVVPPIVQLLVFGYAATFDLNQAPIGIYDEDGSASSRELAARFAASAAFHVVNDLRREDDIAPLLDRREALLVVRMRHGFGRAIARRQAAQVQLLVDGRNSNTAMIALGYSRAILSRFEEDLAVRSGAPPPPVRLGVQAWFNPNLESRWFIVPGIVGLLTLVVSLLVTSLSVARERESGTFDQLLVTPLRPFEILAGKALPGLLVGLVEGTVIVLAAALWFGVPLRGSLLALYLGLFLFLLAAVGVGLAISSLAVTQQQGLLGAFLFLVPAVILSGFATPIANMPPFIQRLTYANPLRYFLVILRGVFLRGDGASELWDQLWPMAAIGCVALTGAAFLFRRRLY